MHYDNEPPGSISYGVVIADVLVADVIVAVIVVVIIEIGVVVVVRVCSISSIGINLSRFPLLLRQVIVVNAGNWPPLLHANLTSVIFHVV